LNLTCDLLVSNFAFKWVNLYRYAKRQPAVPTPDDDMLSAAAPQDLRKPPLKRERPATVKTVTAGLV
jgi:hypothetical protein